MSQIIETFERTEKKYRLNREQYNKIVSAINGKMAVDEFGKSKITSLYFDTPDRRLIDRSLEKPLYKEKLRLRQYGTDESDQALVFIELKKKFKGIVYKRRVMLSRAAAQAFLQGMDFELACRTFPLVSERLNSKAISPKNLQIAREIEEFINRTPNLYPSMLISCNRTAYQPLRDSDANLRITFDEDLKSNDLFKRGEAAQDVIPGDEVIMEVKSVKAVPVWLAQLLSEVHAYPTSFSKYGTAYRNSFNNSKKVIRYA